MAKVKIILEDGESELDADLALLKALNLHASGDIHLTESFDDPAMIDAQDRMIKIHEDMYKDMMDEIFNVIDDEYSE